MYPPCGGTAETSYRVAIRRSPSAWPTGAQPASKHYPARSRGGLEPSPSIRAIPVFGQPARRDCEFLRSEERRELRLEHVRLHGEVEAFVFRQRRETARHGRGGQQLARRLDASLLRHDLQEP